jgi:hypothetical protein
VRVVRVVVVDAVGVVLRVARALLAMVRGRQAGRTGTFL